MAGGTRHFRLRTHYISVIFGLKMAIFHPFLSFYKNWNFNIARYSQ